MPWTVVVLLFYEFTFFASRVYKWVGVRVTFREPPTAVHARHQTPKFGNEGEHETVGRPYTCSTSNSFVHIGGRQS